LKAVIDELHQYLKTSPANEYLNLEVLEIGDGYCYSKMPHNPQFVNAFGTIHGGALMTFADLAFFLAIATANGLDSITGRVSTSEMKTNFLAACKNVDLFAEARIIKNGSNLIFGEVSIKEANNKLVSYSTVTYFRKSI